MPPLAESGGFFCKMQMSKKYWTLITWLLRAGVCGTFAGHGMYAITVKPTWITLITSVGFTTEFARMAMPVIGWVDMAVVLLTIVKPHRYLFAWAAFWCALTALSRFTAGESVLEVLERFSNIACPLTLSFLYGKKKWMG